MRRRHLLLLAGAAALPAHAEIRRRPLVFPRDHGAHPDTRTEWWYATGWAGTPQAPRWGFQLTFFRSRTGLAAEVKSRFAPRQILFAHAALTDLDARRHHHAQRIARWSGDGTEGPAWARTEDVGVRLGDWWLERAGSGYRARLPAADFGLDLELVPTQPLLLQGDAGFSRKGPDERQASHYVSEPQLAANCRFSADGRPAEARGVAWMDHEWSDEILHPEAVGWDWIGINLFDGSALTAFRLRRADGSALWAGGSWRAAGGTAVAFAPGDVVFTPGRRWASPATRAEYPVEWQVDTPAGRWRVRALLDGQELDSRGGTGAVYWEGLSELLDGAGRRVGLGYLEMTGYSRRLQLG
ncbi:lipocalin-like domain-containing protein [Rubrivivax gelatinosus]|uniref:Putative secreted hydrolase n=1 Tax=Rubrivivax gelatinosus TaxID=28068 RepID=A0A4R2MCR0_RUBGE|nr:lipocalin-like domain-containing protein [Rubrivivax gelatinosus]MBK1687031.1 carotenoid 1,2-hydratase [Rubrivivax gelatinosus]TCP02214.1 putative secreted hydrolase [Rubrivivax gelatinosus]